MYWNMLYPEAYGEQYSWIVTLDVLKWQLCSNRKFPQKGWIVTLDVLKFKYIFLALLIRISWIVTLDVLK